MGSESDSVTVDVLVVGSGGGALTAAVTAAIAGLDVLVVEKNHIFGGTSATSGGAIWIPRAPEHTPPGVDDRTEMLRYLEQVTAGAVPRKKLEAYVHNGRPMVDFLQANTQVRYVPVNWPDYWMSLDGGADGWRSHEPAPIWAGKLGESYLHMGRPHPSVVMFERFTWMLNEIPILLRRGLPFYWLAARFGLQYALDFGWRLRHRTKTSRRLTGGNALIGRLKLSLDDRGVPLWRSAPMKELLTSDGGVDGAVIEREGKRVIVRARRGVILGSGGFDHAVDLRKKYLPNPTGDWSAGVPSNTGDGLLAGLAAGAATEFMDSAWWCPTFVLRGEQKARPALVERALPFSIMVDQAGRRFVNECLSYHAVGDVMNKQNTPEAPTVPCWFVFDANFRARYVMAPLKPGKVADDAKLPPAMRDVLLRADTVEALAAKMGIPPKNLAQTVERFNGFARNGVDDDFKRGGNSFERHTGDPAVSPNPTLGPLEKPPFYAFQLFAGDLGTNGGLKTDENGQVLAEDGRPIRGLYAIGNVSGSALGPTYPGGGATIGPAMVFGWLAAGHAAAQPPRTV